MCVRIPALQEEKKIERMIFLLNCEVKLSIYLDRHFTTEVYFSPNVLIVDIINDKRWVHA